MACKLRCPNCKTMLKIKDDHGKDANGEYVVTEEDVRYIECLECGFKEPSRVWADFELKEMMGEE